MVVRSFENPVTKTSYRLTVHGDLWRIIKSRTRGDQLVIRSLRGNTAEGPVEPSLLDRLVRGEKEISLARGKSKVTDAPVVSRQGSNSVLEADRWGDRG